MKAISIRAPWWWFILHGGKDIENRDWPTKFRGTVYVHASKWWRLEDVSEDTHDAVGIYDDSGYKSPNENGISYRQMRDLGGHIVGTVDIIDCVSESKSPWFFGKYGFVLANPRAFPEPIPCKGALGFFEVPGRPPLSEDKPTEAGK
jgi:hypothetical protein